MSGEHMTLWLVTAGAYSDYHIVGIFTDESAANELLEAIGGPYREADIEEWTTDERVETVAVKCILRVNDRSSFNPPSVHTVKEWNVTYQDRFDGSHGFSNELFSTVVMLPIAPYEKLAERATKTANERLSVALANRSNG